MRAILLALAYSTGSRAVYCDALGVPGDTRMSWKWLSPMHRPGLITYTPGQTAGLIPPFEVVRPIPPVLENGIDCAIVGEFVHFTTYRFAVRVANALDFPVGLIVTVTNEYASTNARQAWLTLAPRRGTHARRGVAGARNECWTTGRRFHPASPYGWTSGTQRLWRKLYVTAPERPRDRTRGLAGRRRDAAGAQRADTGPAGAGLRQHQALRLDGRLRSRVAAPPGATGQCPQTLQCTLERPPTPSLLDPPTYFRGGFDSLTNPPTGAGS